jgi:transcription antitermination factor NusG
LLPSNTFVVTEPKPFHTAAFPWYAVRVKPNFEQTTARWFASKGFEQLAPTYRERRQWSDRVKDIEKPLFPGYILCRFDPRQTLPILQSPGVLSIVAFGKKLAAGDSSEVENLRAALESKLGVRPWPFLNAGRKVVISGGPLRGVQGVVVENGDDWRLVLSVELLQRSVSVELRREWVEPLQ